MSVDGGQGTLLPVPLVLPSLSHWPWLPGHHGGEIIGFVVTSSGCQERASALVSDEDISVTATLREDQLVHWASLIKLTACHVQAGQEEASCSVARVRIHRPGQGQRRRGKVARSGAESPVTMPRTPDSKRRDGFTSGSSSFQTGPGAQLNTVLFI